MRQRKIYTYQWSGIVGGRKIEGEIQAMSRNLAKIHLAPTMKLISLHKKRKFFSFKLSSTDLSLFYRQLATLLTAGIPIVQSLDILSKSEMQVSFSKALQSINHQLESGKNLATALGLYPRYFDGLTCHLVQIAEHTGTLDKMLTRIADYKEKTHLLQTQLKQALFYPAVIFTVAITICLILLLYVVPQFAELFATFHHALPAYTQDIIQFSHFLRHDYGLAGIPIIFGFGLRFFYVRSPTLAFTLDQFLLNLVVIGTLIKKFIIARFARTLATLFEAGIPINDALKFTVNISHNKAVQAAVQKLHLDIVSGIHLHQSLSTSTVFPTLMVQMVKVGEESGALSTMLEKIATFYEADIDYWMNNFSHLLEPLIIVILGVLIGGLVIAMYLPIFKLGTIL